MDTGTYFREAVAALSSIFVCAVLSFAALSYRHRGKLIAELHRKKRLEADRQAILEMVARRKPISFILQRIARSISVNCPGSAAGVIRVQDGTIDGTIDGTMDGAMEVAAGRHLPERLRNALGGVPADRPYDEIWRDLEGISSLLNLSGCHFTPIWSGDEELLGAIVVLPGPSMDISIVTAMSNLAGAAIDNARLYDRLARLAGHDPLTGLANRLTFESQLAEALLYARQNRRTIALFFLDLDGFKQINDTLGHRVGDLVLKSVAERFSRVIPKGNTLARMGGDEFTLLLRECPSPQSAKAIAGSMLEALREPWIVDGHEVPLSASIGISFYPQDGDDPEMLQKHADCAMYRAKARGKNCYELFSDQAVIDDLCRLGSALTPPAPSDRSVPHS